jgi:hypothetical protein
LTSVPVSAARSIEARREYCQYTPKSSSRASLSRSAKQLGRTDYREEQSNLDRKGELPNAPLPKRVRSGVLQATSLAHFP